MAKFIEIFDNNIQGTKHLPKSQRICCAPGCRSNFSFDSDPVKTFPFPTDRILRSKWLMAIKADRKFKLVRPHICVKHFEDQYLLRAVEIEDNDGHTIVYPNGEIELTENAVPTIFFNEQPPPPPTSNTIGPPENFENFTGTNYKGIYEIETIATKISESPNFCRICLANNVRLLSLANVRDIGGGNIEISNTEVGSLFEHILNIKTCDLPHWIKICFLCHNQLETFLKFQRNALTMHMKLLDISKNPKLMEISCNNSQQKIDITNDLNILNQYVCEETDLITDELNENEYDIYEEEYLDENIEQNDVSSIVSETDHYSCDETGSDSNINYIPNSLETSFKNITNQNKVKPQYYNNEVINSNFVEQTPFENKNPKVYSYNSNKKKFECDVCKKIYPKARDLKVHKKLHFINDVVKCYICYKYFAQQKIKEHIQSHSISLKCDVCEFTFSSAKMLTNHKRICFDKKNQLRFKCRLCLEEFSNLSHYKMHMKTHKKLMNCPICDEPITSNYNDHMKMHNINIIEDNPEDDDHESLMCQICNIIYGTKQLLQKHLYHDHTVEYKFKCIYPNCLVSVLNEVYLKNHIKDHKDPDRQDFIKKLNEQISQSKIAMLKQNFKSITPSYNESEEINSAQIETKYTIQNISGTENEDYEIILEENNQDHNLNEDSKKFLDTKPKIEFLDGELLAIHESGNCTVETFTDTDFMELDVSQEYY